MDYDDIDKIAESMSDSISFESEFEFQSLARNHNIPSIAGERDHYYSNINQDYDIPNHSKTVQPLLNRHGSRAKSITLIESNMKPTKRKPAPAPKPVAQEPTRPALGMVKRALEL